jgi:hypothetical protein
MALACSCIFLLACSGSSSGRKSPAEPGSGGDRVPTLTLSASPATVSAGGVSTLSWSSVDAGSCDASGGWGGGKSTSGSEDVGPIDGDTEYRLSCSGAGGGVSRQVTVGVDAGNGPTVTLQAEPEQVALDDAATLTWSSDNATACTASGAWSGEQDVSGRFDTGPLTATASFSLSCVGPSGNALASVTVEVMDNTLQWQAPTHNVDGSPLTDLAGYNIYWGVDSRAYGTSHTIDDPAITSWDVDIPPGTYFFALTAFDAAGSESGYSNEVIKTIP